MAVSPLSVIKVVGVFVAIIGTSVAKTKVFVIILAIGSSVVILGVVASVVMVGALDVAVAVGASVVVEDVLVVTLIVAGDSIVIMAVGPVEFVDVSVIDSVLISVSVWVSVVPASVVNSGG